MSKSKLLILTGMHRSGTSLVASLLQAAGVNVGKSLLEADKRNPHGFFEDKDFYEFHQQALYRCGELTPYVSAGFVFRPTQAEIDQALSLIQQRNSQPLWGWKDPRSCLFLDFWDQLLPEAQYVFVYRHPLEVLLSFIRRGEPHTSGLLEALESWCVYNSKIITFYRRHPNQAILGHTYKIIDHFSDFKNLLEAKFNLKMPLDPTLLESRYHPDELRRLSLTPELTELLSKLHPASVELYQEFEAVADLPSPPPEKSIQTASDLSPLFNFTANLPVPYSSSLVRSLLFLLLSWLEADLVDSYFKEHNHYIAQLEYHHGQLKNQVAQKTYAFELLEAELIGMRNSYTWRLGRRLVDSPPGQVARYFLRLRR